MRTRLAAALVAGALLAPATADAAPARARALAAVEAPPTLGAALLPELALPAGETVSDSFADPEGDADARAPDLAATTVWSDADGLLTFRSEVPNRPTLRRGDFYALFLDADANPLTGNRLAGGADFALVLEGTSRAAGLAAWAGIRWDFRIPQASLRAAWSGGPIVSVSREELGGTASVRFWHGASTTDRDGATFTDVAPGAGVWAHVLRLAVPATGPGRIEDARPPAARALPSRGRAGAPVALRYRVSDDWGVTRERISVYRGRTRLRSFRTALLPSVPGVVYWFRWTPAPSVHGRLRFCVRAWDEAGNTTARSCAPVRVARRR